jgi:hypothetical protein
VPDAARVLVGVAFDRHISSTASKKTKQQA